MGTNSVYVIQPIGDAYSSNPSVGEPSDALRVLYFCRKHGGKITLDQINQFVIQDRYQAQRVLRQLVEMKALQQIA